MQLLTIREWFLSERGLSTLQRLLILLLLAASSYQLALLSWRLVPAPQTTASPSGLMTTASVTPGTSQEPQQRLMLIRDAALFGIAPPTADNAQTNAPKSRLNAQLTGIMASSVANRSIAIIARNNVQQSYVIDDVIQGTDARITRILPDRVIISRQGQQEALWLDENAATDTNMAAPEQNNISGLRQNLLKNPGQLPDYLSITPVMENDKLQGYRLNPGKNPEFFNQSGLQANDLAISINGLDLRDKGDAAMAMQQLTHQTEMNITVERNGAEQDVYINLAQP